MSYVSLPKDTKVHKDWIYAVSCQVDNLPSKIFICLDHFEEKCFNPTWKLQNELHCKDRQISRRLLPGSISTFLLGKSTKMFEQLFQGTNKTCLLPFFWVSSQLTLANFIHSELPNLIQAEAYSESYQICKTQVFGKNSQLLST